MCTTLRICKPFPVTQQNLAYFVAYLHREGIAPGTVKSYLAALRHSQIALGLGDPHMGGMVQLEYVIKGLKRVSGPQASRTRLPITPTILRKLGKAWDGLLSPFDASMLWAAALMCFFGFLRSGEVVIPTDSAFDPTTHLAYGDVRVDSTVSPTYLEVKLKSSKTDPFRMGATIFLGRTQQDICPVAAVLHYMVLRGKDPGIFFRFEDGKPLTRERLVHKMREGLSRAGIDASKYAGHSFRVGAATTAAQRGVPDWLIKAMGRWQSAAYQVYIRTPRDTICAVAGTLAHSRGS